MTELDWLNLADNEYSRKSRQLERAKYLKPDFWHNNSDWRIGGSTPTEDELDTFFGVKVGDGRVIGLLLSENNLNGEIPAELSDLTELDWLNLADNGLSGSIPASLGNLNGLNTLNLSGNNLSGKIPDEFSDLTDLDSLNLADNGLSGNIPASLGDLNNLDFLSLKGNNLSGEIPAELSELTNLFSLSLADNGLSGNIPASFGDLNGLSILNLSGNSLSGEIPAELSDMTDLAWLDLRDNLLSGSMPPSLAELSNLGILILAGNELTGEIPPELGQLSGLEVLYLDDNELTGTIPDELWNLTDLGILTIDHNSLTGGISSGIAEMRDLFWLDISNNSLAGELPQEMTSLTELSTLKWGQTSGTSDELCAPTNEEFQDWLASLNEAEGPNCTDSASHAAKSIQIPAVQNVAVTSLPGPDGIYSAGEDIEAEISFDGAIPSAIAPVLHIEIGGAAVKAKHVSNQGSLSSSSLLFRYTVKHGDIDRDGISIKSGALQFRQEPIRGQSRRGMAQTLGPHAIVNDAGHIVVTDVSDAEQLILKSALAANARARLNSATAIIGSRFTSDSSFAWWDAKDFRLRNRARKGMTRQDPGIPRQAAGFFAESRLQREALDGTERRMEAPGTGDIHSIPLNRGAEERRKATWTIWSSRDSQYYHGTAPSGTFDGDLDIHYMGMDRRIGSKWLVGTAVSRSGGGSTYSIAGGSAPRDSFLDTESTMLHPYAQRKFRNGLKVWAVGGIGEGESELRYKGNPKPDRAELLLHLGAVGFSKGLVEFRSVKLDMVADAGYARMQTGSSENRALDNLSIAVNQTRVGLEAKHEWKVFGKPLMPVWRVSGRYDGGGTRGLGMEVRSSAMYQADRARLMVAGRWLATHNSGSIREFASSASLEIVPRSGGLGWEVSLSSRREASGTATKFPRTGLSARSPLETSGFAGIDQEAEMSETIRGIVAYGLPFARANGMLKPFAEVRRIGSASQLRRVGIQLSRTLGRQALELQFTIRQAGNKQELTGRQVGVKFKLTL